MKRILVCAVLVFAVRASGQPPGQTPSGQPPLPVVIESWHYDPQAKVVILHLVNNSHKDVTAFNISIAERYADGSTDYADGRPNDIHDHQKMEDLLGAMISFQSGDRSRSGVIVPARRETDGALQEIMRQQMIQNLSGNGIFAAGTSRDVIDFVSKDVSDIEVILDVVAYADGTADVQNNDRAFRNLMAERKGGLLAMEKVNDVIKRVLADPMVSDPVSAALNELLPYTESLEANTKNGSPEVAENNVARNLRGDIRNLQYMQRDKITRESLARYVEYQEKQIALLKPHANLSVNLAEVR
jgi:hypothetical protein